MTTGRTLPARVGEALRKYWGFDTLRPLQADAIAAAISGRDALVILPTGGGKSLCFQVPPVVTGKLTVVVSPLIALMKDQVDGLKLAGYPAAALYTGVSMAEQQAARQGVASGEIKLLLVAPERLLGGTDESGGSMGSALLSMLTRVYGQGGLGGFAIDEAHCISQWGHDFRPEYRRLVELRGIFPGVPIQAYTATATPQVREDILNALQLDDPAVLVGTFDRPNLTYRILPRVGNGDGQIVETLKRHAGNAAIVYCISRKDTERVAEMLTGEGIAAQAYHAGLDHSKRHRVQEDFLNDRLSVVCATVAFGMGIDRGDVRCVIHAASPKSVEAYQQETGRAGRDGLAAECVLLYSSSDAAKWIQLTERSAAGSDVYVSPKVVEAQKELILQMQRLANSARCRHRALTEHFGQVYEPPVRVLGVEGVEEGAGAAAGCGACDVCLAELEEVPGAQVIAQKIVSCVARLRGPSGVNAYGAAYVCDVLRGSRSAKIIERGHDGLSTFGLLKEMSKEVLASYIAQLVDTGALTRDAGEYPVIMLGEHAMGVVKNTHRVRLLRQREAPEEAERRGKRGKAGPRAELSREESGLFEDLRALRKELATTMGVPPYVVFGDTALEAMARARPTTLANFAEIRGVGQAKLEQFGEKFTAAVAAYCKEHGLATDVKAEMHEPESAAAVGLVGGSAGGSPTLTANARSAGKLFARGYTLAEVCAQTGRAASTVCGYLEDYVRETKPATMDPWVDAATYARVLRAFHATGASTLKPVFEELGGEVEYNTIRVVLAHYKAVGTVSS